MRRPNIKTAVVNLLILLLGALPLTFLLIWVGNLILGYYAEVNVVNAIASGYSYTVVYLLPVALGGIIHQALVCALPRSWTPLAHRVGAVALTAVIPLTLLVLGQPVEVVGWFAVPIGLSLLVYGLLMRLPVNQSSRSTAQA